MQEENDRVKWVFRQDLKKSGLHDLIQHFLEEKLPAQERVIEEQRIEIEKLSAKFQELMQQAAEKEKLIQKHRWEILQKEN